MTEHSVEELERQYQSASDKWRAAELALREAGDRLQEARNEASGIIGHVLEYTTRQGFGRMKKTITRRLLVKRVAKSHDGALYAYGRLIVASGEMGMRSDHVEISRTTDKGPYEAPK